MPLYLLLTIPSYNLHPLHNYRKHYPSKIINIISTRIHNYTSNKNKKSNINYKKLNQEKQNIKKIKSDILIIII